MSTAAWYYAKDGTRLGPITDTALGDLVRQGTIGPTTLVWRAGMADWQPWAQVAVASVMVSPGANACIECGRAFAPDDLVELMGARVCAACKPVRIQRIREGLALEGAQTAYADGKDVVVTRNGVLPGRCVCCNAPATTRLRRQFQWYPPWVNLLIIFPGLLIAVILMLVLRRKMPMEVPLCDEHRRRRTRRLIECGVWGVGSLALLAVSIPGTSGTTTVVFVLGSIISALGALVAGSYAAAVLRPRRITDDAGRFRGAAPDFLASLPTWPGQLKV